MSISERHKARVQKEKVQTRKVRSNSSWRGILLVIVILGALYFARTVAPKEQEQPKPLPVPTPTQLYGEALDEALSPQEKVDALPWNLLVVNTQTALPKEFMVDLANIPEGRVDVRCASALRSMLEAATADGITITVTSAYRNVSKQKELYQRDISKNQREGYSEEEAIDLTERHIQPPGYSEHHTGLAVDFITPSHQTLDEGFINTDAYRWLSEHSVEYGFILRYPEGKEDETGIDFEPWHFRYVGIWDAKKIKESELCLEEYVKILIE